MENSPLHVGQTLTVFRQFLQIECPRLHVCMGSESLSKQIGHSVSSAKILLAILKFLLVDTDLRKFKI